MKFFALRKFFIKVLPVLLLFTCLTVSGVEADTTVAWDQATTNSDGSAMTDLAGYKIYYDTDVTGAPYSGTGITQGSSPVTVPLASLSDASNPEFVLSGLTVSTTYYVAVTAYDTSSNESGYSNEITATESPPPVANDPPTAGINATPTQGMAPLSVSLSGTGTDTDGTITGYTWAFGDGSNSTQQNPTKTYTSAGTYTATLTVTDDDGDTGTDTVQITVTAPPVDTTSPVATITSPTSSSSYSTNSSVISLSGTASDDTGITTVVWSNDQGGNGTAGGTTSWTTGNISLVQGYNTITVIAHDAAVNTGTDTITVLYTVPNSQPAANAGSDQTVTQSQLEGGSVQVTLDGSASSDPDGDSLSFSWTQTQGSSVNLMGSTTAAPFFSATSSLAGESLFFRLVVNDGSLESNPDTVIIFVEDLPPRVNDPPTVNIGATPTEGMAPLSVSLSGTGTDTDGTVTNYTWVFGDGSSTNVQNPSHTYTSAGSYTATLTVTDNDGAETTSTVTINVTQLPADQDSDTDGITDQLELDNGLNLNAQDSDADGIDDFTEWGSGSSPLDSDGDGIIDAIDDDSDDDGKPDSQEGVADDDGDGAPNYTDIDDTDGPLGDQDEDGINNSTEVTYLLNPNQSDTDADGIDDGTEFGILPWPCDSDGDGLADALDLDSDSDGKPDSQEGIADDDQDGSSNYIDINDTDGPEADQDGDGFSNQDEALVGLNPNLSDSDLDGIPDSIEAEDANAPADTDGDGVIDAQDPDTDNDGIPDSEEFLEDMDGNGLFDRKDATTATFSGKAGKMALKLATGGCRLSAMKYIPEAISTDKWRPSMRFRYGGMQFKIMDVPAGGTVNVEVMVDHKIHRNAQYWKYDQDLGYYQLETTVFESSIQFSLTDGGIGDSDKTVNGIIEDPGFVTEPEEAADSTTSTAAPSPATVSSGGGGGSGCRVATNSSGLPDGLLIFLPALLLLILKRMRKI
jgi:PKD repeat protein